MTKQNYIFYFLAFCFLAVLFGFLITSGQEPLNRPKNSWVSCNSDGCQGSYKGGEFVQNSDVAHQFSNTMSHAVGEKLKELYNKGIYVKVNLNKIKMSTHGMGTGKVHYRLNIPFVQVSEKCNAFTSFDHSGGWNHSPDLDKRVERLKTILLPNDSLNISPLLKTREGLQEYWIQWRNKETQAECGLGN